MNNITDVVKLQLVNRQAYVVVPLIVLGGAFLMALLIFALIPATGPKYAYGATFAPLWSFAVVGGQALTATFPFSQALSVTRRDFHVGALATAVLTSSMLAAVYVVIAFIERLTDNWGLNGYFTLPGFDASVPGVAFIGYFALAMLFFVTGYFSAAVQRRWGTPRLIASYVALAVVLTAASALITRAEAWQAVGAWMVSQGALGMSLWVLALVALLASSAYLVVRRIVQ